MGVDLWIASPSDLPEWIGTWRVAEAIGCSEVYVVGLLHCLWFHAARNRPDGNISDYSDNDIARVVGHKGDATVLAQALRGNGFINADGVLGRWDFLFSDHMDKRAQRADKMRQLRERQSTIPDLKLWRRDCGLCRYCARPIVFSVMTVDHVIPPSQGGSNIDGDNLVTACRSCNARKGRRTPDQAGMVLLPIPDGSGIIDALMPNIGTQVPAAWGRGERHG